MYDIIELTNRPSSTFIPLLLIVGFNKSFYSKVKDIAEVTELSFLLFL
jgi:hypothetical protein